MDDSFVKAPVSVPKLSGFDKGHHNLFSSKVGTITPILFDELVAGSRVHCKMAISASLPPLASETFMRCSIKTEAFFVPLRLLCASFENWFTDSPKRFYLGLSQDTVDAKAALPYIRFSDATEVAKLNNYFGSGTLADYLGFRTKQGTPFVLSNGISALPFLAYHRIYNDWYRNTLVQKECFNPSLGTSLSPAPGVNPSNVVRGCAVAPFTYYTSYSNNSSYYSPVLNTENLLRLADGVNVLSLRQRNFGLDYFTTATPQPQQGAAQVVSFDTSGTNGQFSIATLRAVNSMQQFKERNNLLGELYVENLFGRYGVRPSDGIAQRSLYLGRGEFEVYSKGVNATADLEGSNVSNPFTSVGTRFGSAYASGDNFVIDFEAKEPGYVFVMATLVPRVTYSSGIDKILTRYVGEGSLANMANPILQNVGPEPIYQYELSGVPSSAVFGYTDRYASFKTKQDSLHGLLRDGESLQSFALQRSFVSSESYQINSAFLQIPPDYLDQVGAVASSVSDYGYWADTYFDYKVSMPIQKYSLPSLQDPAYEHGKTVVVSKGGSKL